jgi:hypothetical protein
MPARPLPPGSRCGLRPPNEDRIRNYLIGFGELGLDTTAMEAHFAELLGAETSARLFHEIRSTLRSPNSIGGSGEIEPR